MRALALALLCLLLPLRSQACETALLLAMDVSNSVDEAEYRLQADGLALALADPELVDIIVRGRVAMAVMHWSGTDRQQLVIGWQSLLSESHVARFAATAQALPRAYVLSDTAPAPALQRALDAFAEAPDCERRVIDVSGDGTPNAGGGMGPARQRAERLGITVNGLAIEPPGQGLAITNFYRRALITRDGFVMTARGHESFADTLRRKMLRELARPTG